MMRQRRLHSCDAPPEEPSATDELDLRAIGNRIAEARKPLTQERLSELVPISTTYLSQIETGRRLVGLRLAVRIARVLQVKPCWLLFGCEGGKRVGSGATQPVSRSMGKLEELEAWLDGLSPEEERRWWAHQRAVVKNVR